MANVNAPNGFRVAKHLTGGIAVRRRRYYIAGGYAANIAQGDMVELVVGGPKTIQRPGAATDRLLGVFDGCYYLDPNQSQPQYNRLWPTGQAIVAGSQAQAWVHDDPKALFEAQMSLAFANTYIGALANLVIGAENLLTKTSADAVDSTTAAANSGANLRIDDLVNRPDVSVGNYARVIVAIALHYYGGLMTGV